MRSRYRATWGGEPTQNQRTELMPADENTIFGNLAKLPRLTKIAAALFLIAKLHGFFGAVTMFVHRPLSGLLLSIAGVSVVGSIVLTVFQLTRVDNPRRLQEKLAWHRAEAERLEAMMKN